MVTRLGRAASIALGPHCEPMTRQPALEFSNFVYCRRHGKSSLADGETILNARKFCYVGETESFFSHGHFMAITQVISWEIISWERDVVGACSARESLSRLSSPAVCVFFILASRTMERGRSRDTTNGTHGRVHLFLPPPFSLVVLDVNVSG